MAAIGFDLFVLLTDGGRTSGLVILIASFVAATGLIWLGEEIADGCAAHSAGVFRTISCRQQQRWPKFCNHFNA
jgi:hypothetical protein